MSWNYRVTRAETRFPPGGVEYAIREVYYDDDGSIRSWTARPVSLTGEESLDIKEDVELILSAFDKPIIDITDEDHPREVT